MSLKAFHIVFITASISLALTFGTWSVRRFYSDDGSVTDIVLGVGSLLVGVALLVYGKYFLKKLKHISYL